MIALDARYVRERPSGIGAMVDALIRLVPPRMPDHNFLLLRHPLARSPLSLAPNVREITLQAEANGPATLFLLGRLVDLSAVRLFHAPSNILPAGLRMPTITTIHDLLWVHSPQLCRSSGLWGHVETAFYRLGIRRALRHSHRIIAISHATYADIRRIAPNAAARTVVVPQGIDPTFSPLPKGADSQECTRARAHYAPGASRHVLAVGRSAPYKNHRRVVEAFLLAFCDDPGTHLILIQRLGSEAQSLKALARAAGAEHRVHVVGAIPAPSLVALYRSALCLCQPSLQEGWGMPASEAMASGCPVLASSTPALKEVLGNAAYYVDPHSTLSIEQGLRALAKDSALRTKLSEAGPLRAQELTWEQTAESTAQVYRDTIGRLQASGCRLQAKS